VIDSCTVSNVDTVLVTLLLLDLELELSPSFAASKGGSVATLCSTMLGVPFSAGLLWPSREFLRELEEGEGDFNRGDVGQEGDSLAGSPFDRCERGMRDEVSVVMVGCN
jgi:hypothetical protein